MPWPRSPQQKDIIRQLWGNASGGRSRAGSHRTRGGACDGGAAGLRPGAATAGGRGGEVLLTRMSELAVSGLVACTLVMSAASLSTLWRTAARLRHIAASWSGEALADAMGAVSATDAA